jgi:hypothetical protein
MPAENTVDPPACTSSALVGTHTDYQYCAGNSDCAATYVCLIATAAGSSSVCYHFWPEDGGACPDSNNIWWGIDPNHFIGSQEWGVCAPPGVSPPTGWVCPASYYGTGDGCDCGCNVFDPDCTSDLRTACQFCRAGCANNCNQIDLSDNSQCL